MPTEIDPSLTGRARLVAVLEARMVLRLLFLLLLEVHLMLLLQPAHRLMVFSLLILERMLT